MLALDQVEKLIIRIFQAEVGDKANEVTPQPGYFCNRESKGATWNC